MKYLYSVRLSEIFENSSFSNLNKREIGNKIIDLINKWHKLGFYHGDLNTGNILITKNDVIFIDPLISDKKDSKNYDLKWSKIYKNRLHSTKKYD